ncbi:MAG: ATP-binding protein, partial [Lachnospiraceae bacterium]|nr:ATP-binding protein [Lachnospiraceae bacterium]
MIKRERYIAPVRAFYDSDLIKIITGVRRCGKSEILKQIKAEIEDHSDNIVFINFEDRIVTEHIQNWKDIVSEVEGGRKNGLCYVFLDEIQDIDDWPLACKTLRLRDCSVFITGSNSKLLAREFTRELSGRYVSFRIRPFVYKEVLEYAEELGREVSISDYLIWGGFPKRLEYEMEEDIRTYLNELDRTIVENDLINRYRVKKINVFRKVVSFILCSNSRIYSAKAISDYMKGHGIPCTSNTVQKWISYLDEAYIIDQADRYSKKAKKVLESSHKLYDCDVGLNSIRCSHNRYDLTHNLENIVYNELIFMGYDITVYDNNGREVDFLAEKGNFRYFIQVAYSVAEDKTYQREMSAFTGLSQIDTKILITNDDIDYSTSNVRHIMLRDFLLLDSL